MLTFDECQQAIREAGDIEADEFQRLIADYIPQNVFTQFFEEIVSHAMDRTDNDVETAAMLATDLMVGFHLGWMLAIRATTGR